MTPVQPMPERCEVQHGFIGSHSKVLALGHTAGRNTGQPAISGGLSVVSFGQGYDGDLYVVKLGGTLHHVVAAS